MLSALSSRRRFSDLTEQEVLALAISSEEDDARIYRGYAEHLRAAYPASAAVFDDMAAEEDGHRQRLIDLHQSRFGAVIPLIRREHVAGFYARKPVWLATNLSLETIRGEARAMERGGHLHLAVDALLAQDRHAWAHARLHVGGGDVVARVEREVREQARVVRVHGTIVLFARAVGVVAQRLHQVAGLGPRAP